VSNQTAFGGMLHHLVELISIVLTPEPLDRKIERNCKQMWVEHTDCGETSSSPRIAVSGCSVLEILGGGLKR